MKMTNFTHRNALGLLLVVCCLTLCFAFAGCRNQYLHTFSRLENEALKYGTVSVGAARVMEYDRNDLEASRKQLRDALFRMRCKWLKDPNTAPQGYWASYAGSYFEVMLSFAKALEKSKQKDPSTYFAGLSKAYEGMIKTKPPRPSEIELIGYYMAAQKFVESEIEDVNLAKVYPVDKNHYRRFVVSLDLTAWVRGKARAALVYIDLYPYEADSWCHEVGEMLEPLSEKAGKENRRIEGAEYKTQWLEKLEGLGGFDPEDINNLAPPTIPEKGLGDCVASCHRWLARKRLLPRIIQVERMGQGEYLILAEGSHSGTGIQLGGTHPAGISGALKAETAKKTEGLMAKVRPLSLAFVAGERRAGWLFMPSRTEGGRMPPTERRLRMVVDIPKDLEKLGIHIHKAFLDADLGILSGAAFTKQMENLDLTRSKLTEAEQIYKTYRSLSTRHYRIIKSRMRNLLYQGWSEEIVVDIPAK